MLCGVLVLCCEVVFHSMCGILLRRVAVCCLLSRFIELYNRRMECYTKIQTVE